MQQVQREVAEAYMHVTTAREGSSEKADSRHRLQAAFKHRYGVNVTVKLA